ANNAITNAAFIGTVGVDWQFSGVGNFSGNPGETDLLLRNSKTGGLEVYDIANNQLTGAAFIGTVGWIGNSRGSPRFTQLVRPISCCATSTPVNSRSTTLRAIPLSEPPVWARSDWTGSSAGLPAIPRPPPALPGRH